MRTFKLVYYNLLIFFLFFLIIEIIFGYWLDKDNFGPYMREHRLKKNSYSVTFNNQTYDFTYKRNYHGFRGDEIKLKDIKALMIGGSTADERYKPEELTIVGLLNQKFLDNSFDLKIINAGIEGQSTLGHIYNFENWFPKLRELKPNFFIFYIGINDVVANKDRIKSSDGHVLNPSKLEQFKDNLKSRSIFYDLLRKIKHKYYNKDEKLIYDLKHALKTKKDKKKFLGFEEALKIYNLEKLENENKLLIKDYLSNIDKLVFYSQKLNAKPIFINQLTETGNGDKRIFILNYSLIKHCKKNKYNCIDLAGKLRGKSEFWWDGIHTTPEGSLEISNIIFPELLNLVKKN